MALIAGHYLVLAGQLEFCVLVMIKLLRRPALRSMALVTFLAKAAFMLIIILMTGITLLRYGQITLLRMAVTALNTFVLAMQGKISFVVVILEIIPGAFTMTAVTHLAELPFMRFIILMTINTFMLCFVVFLVSLMTRLAGDSNMTAAQAEIRCVMIECLFVKQDYRHISALVFTMTNLAFLGIDVGNASMKPPLLLNIVRDILVVVAIKA